MAADSRLMHFRLFAQHLFHFVSLQWIRDSGRPLGQVSEQEVEDSHGQFGKTRDCFACKLHSNPAYLPRYYRAVLDHNRQNLGYI